MKTFKIDISNIDGVKCINEDTGEILCQWYKKDKIPLPPKPDLIKLRTVYEGLTITDITDGFHPKGILEHIDYWFYKRGLKNND